MINKLRNESGLLTEPNLLRDMEDSMKELKLAAKQLEDLKQENQLKTQQLRNIRKNIEHLSEEPARKKKPEKHGTTLNATQKGTGPILHKGRPSIAEPKISTKSFTDLRGPAKSKQKVLTS